MLTIKEPLRLKTATAIAVTGEDFAQRLLANQQTDMRAISPQQLLHVLGVSPEPPAPGNLLSQNFTQVNSSQHQQLSLQVVNHIVNRILLSQSQRFTYQDNVYVSRVLRKLGVTNVAAFMRQIQATVAEAKAMDGLVQLSRQDLHQFTQTVQQLTQELAAPPSPAALPGLAPGQESENILYNRIFFRLQTSSIYQDMRRWGRNESSSVNLISTQELQLAEQNRAAASWPLLQTQSGTQLWQTLTLSHHLHPTFTQQEEGEKNVVPTEEKAMAELAAAGLLGLVTNVLHSRIENFLENDSFQVKITGTAAHSAENAVIRHLQQSVQQTHYLPPHAPASPAEEMLRFAEEQPGQQSRELLRQIERETAPAAPRPTFPVPANTAEGMRYNLSVTEGPPAEPLENQGETNPAELRHPQPGTSESGPEPVQTSTGSPPLKTSELMRSIERVEQHNREILRQIEAVAKTESPRQAPTLQPDSANIMRDALSMLEGRPAEHLEPLSEMPSADISHPARSAALQHILDTADPQTRTIYETLLQYQQDPGGTIASGILRPADPGILHDEIQRVVREQAETVHRQRTERTQTEHETSQRLVREAVLQEHKLAFAAQQKPAPPPPAPPPVRIVHRQQPTPPPPEEGPAAQRPPLRQTDTLQKTETHTSQVTEWQELQEVNRQTVATTTEDIVALVNKTLQRELGGLSDRVYNKMEKRLQSERLRRGW